MPSPEHGRSSERVRAEALALVADGQTAEAVACIGAALDRAWDKGLFALQARIVHEAGDSAWYEDFLVREVLARPHNLHAMGVLVALDGDRVATLESFARWEARRAEGVSEGLFEARRAALHLANGDRGLAWAAAIRALDATPDAATRRVLARLLAGRFDWHGHPRDAENLLMRGRAPPEMFDAITDLAEVRSEGRIDETTRALLGFLTVGGNPRVASVARLHFDWRWRVDGPSPALLAESAEWEALAPAFNARLRAERIAMACELGMEDAARAMLIERPKAAAFHARVLPVARLIARGAVRAPAGAEEAAARAADLLDSIERASADLIVRLRDRSLRIAIVGNSPCGIGSGDGPRIDAHDIVVRFNRVDLTDAFAADYGRRTDIHCVPIRSAPLIMPTAAGAVTVFTHPHARFRFRSWDSGAAERAALGPIGDLPSDDHARLTRRLRAPPSSGLRFLHMLHGLRGAIPRDSVFGFAFTDQLGRSAASSHYFEATRPSMRHNWPKERAIFAALLTA